MFHIHVVIIGAAYRFHKHWCMQLTCEPEPWYTDAKHWLVYKHGAHSNSRVTWTEQPFQRVCMSMQASKGQGRERARNGRRIVRWCDRISEVKHAQPKPLHTAPGLSERTDGSIPTPCFSFVLFIFSSRRFLLLVYVSMLQFPPLTVSTVIYQSRLPLILCPVVFLHRSCLPLFNVTCLPCVFPPLFRFAFSFLPPALVHRRFLFVSFPFPLPLSCSLVRMFFSSKLFFMC